MMFVAAPPLADCREISITGFLLKPVKYSVTNPMPNPQKRPIKLAQKTPKAL